MTLDARLRRGIPLSEYFQIKKVEKEITNHTVVKYATIGGGFLVVHNCITKLIQEPQAVMCGGSGIAKLDIAGNKILNMARGVSYWIVAAVAVFQILDAIIKGDKHKITEVLLGTALAYGSLFLITFILDLIKDTLG